MSRILAVASSNYKIQVANGGTITLDTQAGGSGYGTVNVNGNLNVFGTTTYVQTTNTEISDNILQLNYGEPGPGITALTAGIEIERGPTTSAAQFLFSESITHWEEGTFTLTNVKITGTAGQFSCSTTSPITLSVGATVTITGSFTNGSITGYSSPTTYYVIGTPTQTTFTLSASYGGSAVTTTSSGGSVIGATAVASNPSSKSGSFVARTADGVLSGIALETITNAGGNTDIVFDMQNTARVLTIANGSAYTASVSRPGDIPNLAFLQNYVASTYVPGGGQGIAIVNSVQYPLTGTLAASNTHIVASATDIKSYVGATVISTLNTSGVTFGYVQVGGSSTPNQITNTSGNNLVLTSTNNRVQVSAVIGLDNQGSTPTYASSGNTIYSATSGPGKSGVFFVNSSNYNDELVAKNRALLLSILF